MNSVEHYRPSVLKSIRGKKSYTDSADEAAEVVQTISQTFIKPARQLKKRPKASVFSCQSIEFAEFFVPDHLRVRLEALVFKAREFIFARLFVNRPICTAWNERSGGTRAGTKNVPTLSLTVLATKSKIWRKICFGDFDGFF